MIDELLEHNIKAIKHLLKNDALSSNASLIEVVEREILFMLMKIMDITNHVMNRDKFCIFKSYDRMIDLLKLSSDLEIVSICLNIVFSNLSHTREPFNSSQNYFREREEEVTRLFYYSKFILDHNNSTSNSSQSLNLTQYFLEDPSFPAYKKSLKPEELSRLESSVFDPDTLHFDFVNPPAGPPYSGQIKKNIFTNNLEEQKAKSIKITGFSEKYKDLHFYCAAKKINQDYQLELQENTPLFDSLVFKVRVILNSAQQNQRQKIVTCCLFALTAFGNKIYITV